MNSLCSALRHVLKLDLESDRTLKIAQATISYLCGVTDAYEYQHYLKENVRFRDLDISAKDFRLLIIEKSYFTLNLKFFSLNLCKVAVNIDNLHHYANAFELVRNDAVLLRRCFSQRTFRRTLRNSSRVRNITSDEINERSIERVRREFNHFYPELMQHIRQKTFKKLRFLVKSENSEFSDFNNELLYKAIKAYYMVVPTTKTDAHMLNYLRTTCTNHALNIINAKTTDKRRRLSNAGADGFGGQSFTLTCVSENQLAVIDGDDLFAYDSTLNDLNQQDNSRLISDINFDRIVKNLGKSNTRRRAILITSGQEDSRFTRYLRSRDIIRSDEDCADFVQRTKHENVVAHMADHFNVCHVRLERFLKKVATELIKHRSVA